MRIIGNQTSFYGLYKNCPTIKYTTGKANINKQTYTVYPIEYYPFENESDAEIAAAVKEYQKGWSYTLFEKDHGQWEGDYYQFNKVIVKKPVKDASADSSLQEVPRDSIDDRQTFMVTHNNESYGTMDVREMNEESINRIYYNSLPEKLKNIQKYRTK